LFRRTCGNLKLVCFLFFAHRAVGVAQTPGIPCALCFGGGLDLAELERDAR
jgi:hypothetical protein